MRRNARWLLRPTALQLWLMVETGDETLDYRQAVAFYCGAKQLVIEGGDHGFQAWQSLLPEVAAFTGIT
jgi:Predicted esterase